MKCFCLFSLALLSMLSTQLSAQTTYLWSTGATTPSINVSPMVTTTYYVTITHNGLEYLDSLVVVVDQPNSSTINATIAQGQSYLFDGQNLISEGTYTATYQNAAGCDSTITLNLSVVPALMYEVSASNTEICDNNTEPVVLSVSIPGAAYPAGYVHCNPNNPTAVVDVTNPVTNKTWMDRNLGANRSATSATDAEAYGSMFQWGRFADGHQCVNRFVGDEVTTSSNTALNATSSTDTPAHGDFIRRNNSPWDWRSPQNTSLWQGASGTNNPCPEDYRLPTDTELNNERLSWMQAPISSTNNAEGAFASPLKLTMTGYRDRNTGSVLDAGNYGYYWSSTVSTIYTQTLVFRSTFTNANISPVQRSYGISVRCIKN